MSIEAISTIQILTDVEHVVDIESLFLQHTQVLENLSGCLAYHAFRSNRCERTWVLTGYWNSACTMQEHFRAPPLTEFLTAIGCYASRMEFRCFPDTADVLRS